MASESPNPANPETENPVTPSAPIEQPSGFSPSPENAKAWLKTAEETAKLVAENLRYGSWTKRFVTIGGVAFLAFNPMTVGKAAEFFGVRELPKWYVPAFGLGMGGILVGAVGAAIVTLPKRTLEAMPERQAIKGLRSFELKDAEIFKRLERGRDVQEVLDAVDTADLRLFVLMGESGVGKSSLLQAGLMPNLGQVGFVGVYVKFTNREPLESIAKALKLDAAGSLVEMLRSAVGKTGKPIVLMLDQFEQFFVQFQEEKRAEFIAELKAWYDSDLAVKILIGIRGDLSDRLVEIQKALGYSLRPDQSYRLERFAPAQATEVLRVIAETEKWSFNQAFVEEMTRDELAGLDGKISPVEVQVLAQMVSREPDEDNQRLDRTAFQKLGGVDGLLGRGLQRSLDAIPIKSDRERALEVLLALTDLERNVRSGAFSTAQLQGMTEKVHGSPSDVEAAVRWLLEARLISPGENSGAMVHELAHERLIPALRQVANQELTDANKANLLLDRRVNEWLGSGKSKRYLFDLKELWLLRKQRGFLEWGQQRSQKEALVRSSWKVVTWDFGFCGSPLILGAIIGLWSHTSYGQVQWTRWHLRNYTIGDPSVVSNPENLHIAALLDTLINIPIDPISAFWIQYLSSGHIEHLDMEANFQIIEIISKSNSSLKNEELAQKIHTLMNNYDQLNRVRLISKILQSNIYAEDNKITDDLLKKAIVITESMKEESDSEKLSKGIALGLMAGSKTHLKKEDSSQNLFNKSRNLLNLVKDENGKAEAFVDIAEAYTKVGDSDKLSQLIDQAFQILEKSQSDPQRAKTIYKIFNQFKKINKDTSVKIIEQSFKLAQSTQDLSIKSSILSETSILFLRMEDEKNARDTIIKSLEILKSIQDSSKKATALHHLLKAVAQFKNNENKQYLFKESINLAMSMKDSGAKINSFHKLITITSGEPDDLSSQQYLNQLMDSISKIEDESEKSKILILIAQIFSDSTRIQGVDEVISKILTLAKGLNEATHKEDKFSAQASILSSHARFYLRTGDVIKAKSLLSEASKKLDLSLNSRAISHVAQIHAEMGNSREALRLFHKCLDLDKGKVLAQILRADAEQKYPEFKKLRELRLKNDEL